MIVSRTLMAAYEANKNRPLPDQLHDLRDALEAVTAYVWHVETALAADPERRVGTTHVAVVTEEPRVEVNWAGISSAYIVGAPRPVDDFARHYSETVVRLQPIDPQRTAS